MNVSARNWLWQEKEKKKELMSQEDRWLKGPCLSTERPSMNRGGSSRHQRSATYDAVFRGLPRHLDAHSHLTSGDVTRSPDRVE